MTIAETPLRTVWLEQFRAALGEANVYGPEAPELARYVDPYAFGEQLPPAAVIRPSTVAEIQACLAVAREHGIPLWTVSRGRNFAYGGPEARLPGTVVCDLGRMDAVISVDDTAGVAIIEPGVSFQALDEHLRKIGSSLAVSVPDLSWGSPVGNTLERGFSYTAHSEHQAMQCGMEVVLADGDIIRTGMGALPGAETWAMYRGSYGPGFDGLFYQSNFGIVTKMGIWLRPRPERSAVCSITIRDDNQLGALIDTLRPLMLTGTIQSNAVIGNTAIVASTMTARDHWYDGPGVMPDTAVRAAMDEFHLGRWNAQFGIYGSPALLAARIAEIREAIAAIPGVEFVFDEYECDVDPGDVAPEHRTQLGIPSNDAISMIGWRGGEPAHADIGLVSPAKGEAVDTLRELVAARVESARLDYTVGFMVWPRHIVAMNLIMFDRSDPDQKDAIGPLIEQVITDAAAAGFGIYRAHTAHMDLAADQYSFNDHASRRFAERLKSALDPAGILAPGKQGIWPQAMRPST
jgi:4-cresol dehydrogenase (hydroxylating)